MNFICMTDMTKEEILEELDNLEEQIRELASQHDVLAEMLIDIEEQEE